MPQVASNHRDFPYGSFVVCHDATVYVAFPRYQDESEPLLELESTRIEDILAGIDEIMECGHEGRHPEWLQPWADGVEPCRIDLRKIFFARQSQEWVRLISEGLKESVRDDCFSLKIPIVTNFDRLLTIPSSAADSANYALMRLSDPPIHISNNMSWSRIARKG